MILEPPCSGHVWTSHHCGLWAAADPVMLVQRGILGCWRAPRDKFVPLHQHPLWGNSVLHSLEASLCWSIKADLTQKGVRIWHVLLLFIPPPQPDWSSLPFLSVSQPPPCLSPSPVQSCLFWPVFLDLPVPERLLQPLRQQACSTCQQRLFCDCHKAVSVSAMLLTLVLGWER